MTWNLSEFTNILFILNNSIEVWLSFSWVEISFSIVFLAALIALSSAKLSEFGFDIQIYKSLIIMLNNIDPSIELWGALSNRIQNALWVFFIVAFYILLFK